MRHGLHHNPSAAVTGTIRDRIGNYDGDFNAIELTSEYRFTARVTASLGWTRQDIDLPQDAFIANLVLVKTTIAFTNLARMSLLAPCRHRTSPRRQSIDLR